MGNAIRKDTVQITMAIPRTHLNKLLEKAQSVSGKGVTIRYADIIRHLIQLKVRDWEAKELASKQFEAQFQNVAEVENVENYFDSRSPESCLAMSTI